MTVIRRIIEKLVDGTWVPSRVAFLSPGDIIRWKQPNTDWELRVVDSVPLTCSNDIDWAGIITIPYKLKVDFELTDDMTAVIISP